MCTERHQDTIHAVRQAVNSRRSDPRQRRPADRVCYVDTSERSSGAGWLIVDVDWRRRRLECSSWPDTLVLCSPDIDGPWQPACSPRVQEWSWSWISVDRPRYLRVSVTRRATTRYSDRLIVLLSLSLSSNIAQLNNDVHFIVYINILRRLYELVWSKHNDQTRHKAWPTSNGFDSDCSFCVPVADDALSLGFQHNTKRSFTEHLTQQQPANNVQHSTSLDTAGCKWRSVRWVGFSV